MATASLNADEEDSSPPSTFASRFRLPRSRSATVASPGDRNARLKTKALSAWNNLRNGWVIPTHVTVFGHDDPIWILGVYYHGKNSVPRRRTRPTSSLDSRPPPSNTAPHIQDFLADFQSRFWMTYRRGFPQMADSDLTTDCGWGCMLRSGQMILAQSLICFLLGRAWRIHCQLPEQKETERMIMRWFTDIHQECSPFSIHTLVDLSRPRGRVAGQWYGPALVSYLLRDAVEGARKYEDSLRGFKVYVAQDCTVYKGDLVDMMDKYREETGESRDCSVLLLVPVRLGGETLNSVYFPCLRGLLTLDHCVGVIGGRPKHSLFFIGWQGEDLVYLDPHCCQEVVDTTDPNFPTDSFHCKSPRKLALTRMDPSCTIGFFVRDRHDFDLCCKSVEEMLSPPMQQGNYPFFTFSDSRSMECSEAAENMDQAVDGGGTDYPTADGHQVMSTFSVIPPKRAANVSGPLSRIEVEPVLVPPPDHVVDDFVVLDVPSSSTSSMSPSPDVPDLPVS
ncbi:cysteine protease ATG4C-like [Sycon ciliatum]|uniref:cysteine protease ATG4C-like n=1 Tax=Sycon ciliatum TaxID=27933 RepID=UPI0031F6682C